MAVVLGALESGHVNLSEAALKLRVRRATLDAALRAVRNGGTGRGEIEPGV